MLRRHVVAALLLLPTTRIAQATEVNDYDRLVAEFAKATQQYRDDNAVVAPLLPDKSPFHAKFLEAAAKQEGDAALPYLGWVLQNAPRNPEAYGKAIAAIDAMAKAREGALGNEKELQAASRKAVKHLKYNRVNDETFARTLLDAKTLAMFASDEGARSASTKSVFKLTRLQVGMVAPDIIGNDLDGVEFKLSDYRGRVVLLDFWGDW